jgi:hypothetical protein
LEEKRRIEKREEREERGRWVAVSEPGLKKGKNCDDDAIFNARSRSLIASFSTCIGPQALNITDSFRDAGGEGISRVQRGEEGACKSS